MKRVSPIEAVLYFLVALSVAAVSATSGILLSSAAEFFAWLLCGCRPSYPQGVFLAGCVFGAIGYVWFIATRK